MLLDKLLNYCEELNQDEELRFSVKEVFLAPYYLYVDEQINLMLRMANLSMYEDISLDLTCQIVNYSYNTYFKYAYPFELKLALENGLIKHSNKKKEKGQFDAIISQSKEWIEYFFDKYPKLLQLLETYTNCIITYIEEIFSHFVVDRLTISENIHSDNFIISNVELFKGDLHNGKCVSLITLSTGDKIYHKPRNANNEEFISKFIQFVYIKGLSIKLGIPKHINRKDYSWHFHVSEQTCGHDCDFYEYFNNWGKLQCLFYFLGTYDIIPDNVICVNDVPYLIDCESLIVRPFIWGYRDNIHEYFYTSVNATDILPIRMYDGPNVRKTISSVLLKYGKEVKHLPHAENRAYPITKKYVESFVNGFKLSYSFLMELKDEIADFYLKYNANDCNSRVLLHPTMIYSCLLQKFVTPKYLSGNISLDNMLDKLILDEVFGNCQECIKSSIKSQIEKGNIPYFFINGNENLLRSNNDVVSFEYNENYRTNIDWLTNKLSMLSKQDCKYQQIIITQSWNLFFELKRNQNVHKKFGTEKTIQNVQIDYVKAVEILYQKVDSDRVNLKDSIGYLGRSHNTIDGIGEIGFLGNSIYEGLSGIFLFFRMLFSITHKDVYLSNANIVFQQICNNFVSGIKSLNIDSVSVSPMADISCILYIMETFPESCYTSKIYLSIIKILKQVLPKTDQYDFMYGIAGLVGLIFQAKLISKDDKDTIMSLCGKRLLELSSTKNGMMSWTYKELGAGHLSKQIQLGGYAHGSSAVAVALYQLFLYTKDKSFYNAFKKALKHDRSLYNDEIKGWVAGEDVGFDRGYWCHGAGGIALSRLQLLSLGYCDKIIKKELMIAVPKIKTQLGGNMSVCHGTLGNLEILKAISICLNCPEIYEKEWEDKIIHEILRKRTVICGDYSRDSNLGLYIGIAGIGYQLIRLNNWDKVPSILCLETFPDVNFLHEII